MGLYRVKLHGSGSPGDPFRVNLPTSTLIHGNIAQGWAIISVPESTLGVSTDQVNAQTQEACTEGSFFPGPDTDFVSTANAYLKSTHPQQVPPYALELI